MQPDIEVESLERERQFNLQHAHYYDKQARDIHICSGGFGVLLGIDHDSRFKF